jgi:signal transduction histidine kinase/DNA-binding NarL/FixJ family response regulator
VDERLERRYLAIAGLASGIMTCSDWTQLAAAVARALGELGSERPVRLWGITPDGVSELARHPGEHPFRRLRPGDLDRTAKLSEPADAAGERLLVGLHADGVTLGVLEVEDTNDRDVVEQVAPIVACRFSVLAGQGAGGVPIAPRSIEEASDASAVIADFARQAKRLLDHDRLSVYLMTPDGRAFERFAVATSTIVPGEGVLIPFEDVGLRHIVLTNQPLVSSDIAADPRIVGREDRVIAQAGFHGLVSVPLRREGRPFGLLNFVSRQPGYYRQEDVPVAQQIADQVAAFVENLQVQRRMQTFVRQEAKEWARARVTRDLYHAVAQTAPEIARAAADLEQSITGRDEAAREQARRIRELAQFEIADIRRAIVDLDPPGLETHSLAEMTELAVERFSERGGVRPRLRIQGDSTGLAGMVVRATYRIVQEALMNVRLHAHATAVEIKLKVDRDLQLVIVDDGIGFDTGPSGRKDGLGLRHMRDRAQALGGFLVVESEPGEGTRVRLIVPGVRDAVATVQLSPRQLDAPPAREVTLRVFVAGANTLLRAGLCRLLEHGERIRIVGEAASLAQLRGQVRQLHPDVILLGAPFTNGDLRSTLEAVRADSPTSAVLAVCDGDRERGNELVELGASGVVHQIADAAELLQAVRAVASGTRVVAGAPELEFVPPETLSTRERSILALLADGHTNAEIGGKLFLATKTVERQVATIARKLKARNRAHAAAIAVSRRLVQVPHDERDAPG